MNKNQTFLDFENFLKPSTSIGELISLKFLFPSIEQEREWLKT